MTATTGREAPRTPDEKSALRASLDAQRDVLLAKLDGLPDADARRPMTPSGTNLVGIVKHLASAEYGWFCRSFGYDTEPLPLDDTDDPEADMRARPDETVADIVAFHTRARAAADAAIDELDLDATGTSWNGVTVSLRWVLVHMVQEEARHAGHADILRELIDRGA